MSGYARLVNIVFWLGLVAWVSAVAAAGVAASATFTILPDLGLTVSGYQLTDTVQHGRLAAGKVMEPVFAFVDVVQLLAAMLVVVACLVQNTLIKVPWRTPANVIRVLGIILAAGLLLGRMALLSPDMNRQLRAYWSAAASGDTAAGRSAPSGLRHEARSGVDALHRHARSAARGGRRVGGSVLAWRRAAAHHENRWRIMSSHALKGPSGKSGFDLPVKTAAERARARRILDRLYQYYPDAHCELSFESPHQLLAAVILSAQATDVSVNRVTPSLFERFPEPADFAAASPQAIEPFIKSIGLFRNKARAIHAAMTTICERFDGQVPNTMEELLTLRGVARKTANVVLGNAFGINEGVVVDTHVRRVSRRFELTSHDDPAKIERDLMSLFPRPHWTMLSHMLIFHGRRVCKARGATCAEHPLCRSYCSNARAMKQRS